MNIEPDPGQSAARTEHPMTCTGLGTRPGLKFIVLSAALAVGFAVLICRALADNPPVLTISNLGSNQFSITITNAANPTNYLLEWTPVLADTNYPWLVVATNAPGETNFVMDMGPWPIGFLRVMVGWDGDNDSVPDWMDAQPLNPYVGLLSVTIDSPLNGSVVE